MVLATLIQIIGSKSDPIFMKNKTQKKKSVSVYKRFQMYNIKKLIFNKLQTHLNLIFLEKQNSFLSPDGRENLPI